jgi:formylmethanofuran dehydrogenase subunit E
MTQSRLPVRTHNFSSLQDFAPRTQEYTEKVKRVLPKKVVREMMLAETEASPNSPVIKCSRCGDLLIQKFMVLIQGEWIHPESWVCRLCYDKKKDIRVR